MPTTVRFKIHPLKTRASDEPEKEHPQDMNLWVLSSQSPGEFEVHRLLANCTSCERTFLEVNFTWTELSGLIETENQLVHPHSRI